MTTFLEETRTTLAADAATAPVRELAQRTAGGVQVALLWNRLDNSLIVSMWNPACDVYLQFAADPGTARDAFNHPCPYAAARGLPAEDVFLAA